MSDGDYVSELFDAIMDKFSGSALFNDLGGRFFQGEYDLNPPVVYPYGKFFIVVGTPDRTFTESYKDIILQVSLLSPKTLGAASLALIYNHMIDLYDECSLSITGYTLLWMRETVHSQMEEIVEALPDGSSVVNHWSSDFEIRISKN